MMDRLKKLIEDKAKENEEQLKTNGLIKKITEKINQQDQVCQLAKTISATLIQLQQEQKSNQTEQEQKKIQQEANNQVENQQARQVQEDKEKDKEEGEMQLGTFENHIQLASNPIESTQNLTEKESKVIVQPTNPEEKEIILEPVKQSIIQQSAQEKKHDNIISEGQKNSQHQQIEISDIHLVSLNSSVQDIHNSEVMTVDTINQSKQVEENHNETQPKPIVLEQNILVGLYSTPQENSVQNLFENEKISQELNEHVEMYKISSQESEEQSFDIILNQMKIITKLISKSNKNEDGKQSIQKVKEIVIEIEPLYPIESLLGNNEYDFSNASGEMKKSDFQHHQASKQLLEDKCLLVARFTNETLPKQLEILFDTVEQLYVTMKKYQNSIFCLDLIKQSRHLTLQIPIFDKKKQFKVLLNKNQLPVEMFLERKNNQLVQQMKRLFQRYTLTKQKYQQLKGELQKHQKYQKAKNDLVNKNSQQIKAKSTTKTDEKTIEMMKSILKRENNSRELRSSTLSDEGQDSNSESLVIERGSRKKTKKNEFVPAKK